MRTLDLGFKAHIDLKEKQFNEEVERQTKTATK